MNKENIIKSRIFEHIFFHNMSKEHKLELANCAFEVDLKQGEFLFNEGEPAELFYLITSGSIDLELYSPEQGLKTIETIGEGEILGWSWLFTPNKWKFDAKALSKVEAIAFDAVTLKKKLETDDAFAHKMYKLFSLLIVERLQATRMRLLDLYAKNEF